MAHKIKVRAVPHINRDGSVGTKKDYIVRCKSRGKVCTHETFHTRREADAHVSAHWDNLQLSRRGKFSSGPRKTTATPKQHKTRLRVHLGVNVEPAMTALRAVRDDLAGVRVA